MWGSYRHHLLTRVPRACAHKGKAGGATNATWPRGPNCTPSKWESQTDFLGTFCPGTAHRAWWGGGKAWLSPVPASCWAGGTRHLRVHRVPLSSTPSPSSQGRARAGATPWKPSPCLRVLRRLPHSQDTSQSRRGTEYPGDSGCTWQPAGTCEGRERQAGKPGHHTTPQVSVDAPKSARPPDIHPPRAEQRAADPSLSGTTVFLGT